jgi:hypothetical protein
MMFLLFVSCANQEAKNKQSKEQLDNLSKQTENSVNDLKNAEKNPMGGKSYIKSITDDAAKDAHIFLPPYPDAVLDKSKGSYNESYLGKEYNLVYHSDDPVKKVAEFFKKNISEDYLTETVSSEAEDWVHLEYNAKGVRQSGSVFITKAIDGSTEIIYDITVESKKTGKPAE